MTRWALLPACLFWVAPVLAISLETPAASGDDDATTLPPIVVHPAPNPLDSPVERLRKSLPDLGYKPPKTRGRLADDINDSNEFETGFYSQTLSADPRLEGPPPAYITEGDGTLAKRNEEEFRAAERARQK